MRGAFRQHNSDALGQFERGTFRQKSRPCWSTVQAFPLALSRVVNYHFEEQRNRDFDIFDITFIIQILPTTPTL